MVRTRASDQNTFFSLNRSKHIFGSVDKTIKSLQTRRIKWYLNRNILGKNKWQKFIEDNID